MSPLAVSHPSDADLKTKEFALGTYDGIAGLFTQPYIGARDEGVVGACKGLAKGVAGMPIKFLAGKCTQKHTLSHEHTSISNAG